MFNTIYTIFYHGNLKLPFEALFLEISTGWSQIAPLTRFRSSSEDAKLLYYWLSSVDGWSTSTSLTVTKFPPLGTIQLFLLGDRFVNVFPDSNQ